MELKIKNIVLPESKLQTTQFDDWYEKELTTFGGKEYQFGMESIIPLLKDICTSEGKYSITDFENGIKVSFYRAALTDEDPRYDEEFDSTPSESAELYIFDDGEVYYVHKGFECSVLFGYENFTGLHQGYEFDTSEISKELNSKLGGYYILGESKDKSLKSRFIFFKSNPVKEKIGEKRKALLAAVLSALRTYNYKEENIKISPSNQTKGL